jgi:hypothetical protein
MHTNISKALLGFSFALSVGAVTAVTATVVVNQSHGPLAYRGSGRIELAQNVTSSDASTPIAYRGSGRIDVA